MKKLVHFSRFRLRRGIGEGGFVWGVGIEVGGYEPMALKTPWICEKESALVSLGDGKLWRVGEFGGRWEDVRMGVKVRKMGWKGL